MKQNERRYVVLLIPDEALLDILNGDIKIKALDLPGDVCVVNIYNDNTRRMMGLVLQSEQFEPVLLGAEIPRLPPLRLDRIHA